VWYIRNDRRNSWVKAVCFGLGLVLSCSPPELTIFVDILLGQVASLLVESSQQGREEATVSRVAGVTAGVLCGASQVLILLAVSAGRVGTTAGC
jgi:hypothetical protein